MTVPELLADMRKTGKPISLDKAHVEGGTWDGRTLSCTGRRARLFFPVENYKDVFGILLGSHDTRLVSYSGIDIRMWPASSGREG